MTDSDSILPAPGQQAAMLGANGQAAANGGDPKASPPQQAPVQQAPVAADGEKIAGALKDMNAGFGEIVALLMRDARFRHMSLADLEWLVLPPLAAKQVLTMRGKVKDKEGLTVPLGLAMWAKVSPEVDAKLEAQKAAGVPFRLAPHEWTSGEIIWCLVMCAPDSLKETFATKIKQSFQGEPKKY